MDASAIEEPVGGLDQTFAHRPDRRPPQIIAGWAAKGAVLSTASVALLAASFGPAVALRVVTGVFLAGVYSVGTTSLKILKRSDNAGTEHSR